MVSNGLKKSRRYLILSFLWYNATSKKCRLLLRWLENGAIRFKVAFFDYIKTKNVETYFYQRVDHKERYLLHTFREILRGWLKNIFSEIRFYNWWN